jgi:hypothetical protein
MEYFIERNQYFDAYGKPEESYYYVYHIKSFLGLFKYKKYAKKTECDWGDCRKQKIRFSSEYNAHKFIKTVLCPGIKTESVQTTIIKQVNCTNEK